jgi:hypothetical protein
MPLLAKIAGISGSTELNKIDSINEFISLSTVHLM